MRLIRNLFLASFTILLTSVTFASPTCSIKGTDIIYTNGVMTKSDDAQTSLERVIEVGASAFAEQDTKKVNTELAYNYKAGLAADFLESTIQKLPSNFLITHKASDPYDIVLSVSGSRAIEFKDTYPEESLELQEILMNLQLNYVLNHRSDSDYAKTLNHILHFYENALNNGRRVFAVSHSQGGLFMDDVYQLVKHPQKHKYFSGFQIATPVSSSLIHKHHYATLDYDRLIGFIRNTVGAYSANVFASDFIDTKYYGLGDYLIDNIINHGILTTYLHDPIIQPQVLSLMSEAGNALDTNCAQAFINYETEGLKVNFDSIYPDGKNLEEAFYNWDFGDGSAVQKTAEETITHTYEIPGQYTVKLTITDATGNILGPLATNEKIIEVNEAALGCDGVNGQFRINYDGTLGGFIANTAHVDESVIISENIEVCGESKIYGSTIIHSGMIKDFRIENSTIRDSSLEMDSYVIYGSGWISNSIIENTTATYAKSFYIENSSIKNSNFGGDLVSVASTIENTSGLRAYIDNSTFRNVSTVHDIWTMNSAVTDSNLNFNGSSLSGDIRNSTITNSTIQIGGRVFRIHSSNVLNSSIVFTNKYYTNDGRGIYYSTLDGLNIVVDEFYAYQNIMTIYFPSGEKYVGPVSEFPY